MKKESNIFIIILSLSFSFFILFGTSFLINEDSSLIFGSWYKIVLSFIIFIVQFLVFYFLLLKLFNKFDNGIIIKNKKIKSKIFKLFDNHPFLFSIIVIIICWIPYIIAFYPIILSPDPSFQIKQFFGIPNKYSTYSILLDKNVIITNHHPVIHTMLLGSCLKLGNLISNDNLGLFLYSIIQIIILSSTLSYTIFYMKKCKISLKYRSITLLIYSLVPVFGFYAMSGVKDVIFGSLIILYIISLYDFIKYNKLTFKKLIFDFLIILLICLFRNNGIYVILLSFLFMILILKKKFFKYSIVFLSVIVLYGIYDKILLPTLKISPPSIRETLSIPFQQTARYVKYHSNEINFKEKNAIDKLLNYDTIATRYNPNLADPVKNEFNKNYTKKDLKLYFETWFNGLIKHPYTYIEATINNAYGYFYPLKTSWYIYYRFNDTILEDGFKYHYNKLNLLRSVLIKYGESFPFIPILGLIVNIGFSSWIILAMLFYLLYKKKYRDIIWLLPALILILVCVASPANAYFRYALPYIFGMPLMIGLFSTTIRKEVK